MMDLKNVIDIKPLMHGCSCNHLYLQKNSSFSKTFGTVEDTSGQVFDELDLGRFVSLNLKFPMSKV